MLRDGDALARGVVGGSLRALRDAAARRARAARQGRGHLLHRQPDGAQLLTSAATSASSSAIAQPADVVLRRHRRPVAEEPRLHADVRRHVVDPDARHPAHRLLGHHGRQPAGVAGQPARLPRRARRDRPHPRARRQGGGHRSAPHRHRRTRRRVDPDHARHRRRPAAGDLHTCSSPTVWCDLGALAGHGQRRRRRARRSPRVHARSGRRGLSRAGRDHPPPGARDRGGAERRPSTAASASATRSSARSPRGWSTSSTSSPAISTAPAA